MKFGIGLFSMQTHPENPSSHAELYRQTLEQVNLAEEMNFDSAWVSEHHFLEAIEILIASADIFLCCHR